MAFTSSLTYCVLRTLATLLFLLAIFWRVVFAPFFTHRLTVVAWARFCDGEGDFFSEIKGKKIKVIPPENLQFLPDLS